MRVIGLTGGIACGKSTLAAFLHEWGVPVLDADELSRAATMPGREGLRLIRDAFGDVFLHKDGTLNRRSLGEFVFQNERARKKLESIIHPIVIKQMKDAITAHEMMGTRVVVLNVPLLYESGSDELCDEVWVVTAPREIQIERILARGGLTKAEALARIDSQMPTAEKEARADYVIEASGPPLETMKQLRIIYDDLLNRIRSDIGVSRREAAERTEQPAEFTAEQSPEDSSEKPEAPFSEKPSEYSALAEHPPESQGESRGETGRTSNVNTYDSKDEVRGEPEAVPKTSQSEDYAKLPELITQTEPEPVDDSPFNNLPRGRIVANPRKVRETYVTISDGSRDDGRAQEDYNPNRPVFDERGRIIYDPRDQEASRIRKPGGHRVTTTITRNKRYGGARTRTRFTRKFYILLFLFMLLTAIVAAVIVYVPQYQRWKERQVYYINYENEILNASLEYDLDPLFVCAIIYIESRFDPEALSRDDAMGLMQLIPGTADWITTKLKTENYTQSMMYDPATNLRYGCWYLRYNLDQFGGILENAIIAYHSGHGQVSRWLNDPEISPDGQKITNIPEGHVNTINYVKLVTETYDMYKELYKVENNEFVEL